MSSQTEKLIHKSDRTTKIDWLVIALNKITHETHGTRWKEIQIDTIIECMRETCFDDSDPHFIRKERTELMDINASILLDALKACLDYDEAAFRKVLMLRIYPILLDDGWKEHLKKGAVYVKALVRLQILRHVFQGWLPSSEDAEECFEFICNAYVQFSIVNILKNLQGLPSDLIPDEDTLSRRAYDLGLRKGIDDFFRHHIMIDHKGDPTSFDGEQLNCWIEKENVPEGIVRVLLHARVNLVDPERAQRELRVIRKWESQIKI